MAGMLDEARGFVFVHVPRTAGASMTSALRRSESATRFDQLPGLHEIVVAENEVSPEVVALALHARARDIRTYLGADRYDRLESFAVVRDPWDRLRSRFHYVRVQPDHPEYPHAQDGLASYVRWACEQHRNSLSDRLADRSGRILIKRLLRFESLAADVRQLDDDLSLGIGELPLINSSSNVDETSEFPREVVALVQRAYERDFELFSYDPNPPGRR